MKHLHKIGACIMAFMIATSCVDDEPLGFKVEKPASVALQEELATYESLKSYINRGASPDFKLGAGISLAEYNAKGVMHRLINSNFDEVTPGYEMKHGAIVQSDGSLSFSNIKALFELTEEKGVTVFGHTLTWHANQNAKYLNTLIAPTSGGSGPSWDVVTSADFETDATANYESNTNAILSFTAAGEGAGGTGRALKITNQAVRTNEWDAQFFVKFAPAMKVGEEYELSMDVRADKAVSFATQAHTVPYAYKHWDFFGSINASTTWTTFSKKLIISDLTAGTGTVAFNLGLNATTYYLDNIKLKKYNPTGGSLIEKTPAEKKEIITNEMERWIAGIMEVSKNYVKAWDVVNEPMDDGKPNELKTGVGKTLPADEFYWQDYMGKDYAVEAFKFARKHGNAGDILFINDYNLEFSIDKCKGLIQYVQYIESKGATVDGIGTQMHISTSTNKENIVEMLQLLAATGKKIKISEMDIGVEVQEDKATDEHYQAQADMYKFVVEKYFDIIPANQRYGITIWSPKDSPVGSSWRAGEPIGLWTLDYYRKPAYAAVSDALAAE